MSYDPNAQPDAVEPLLTPYESISGLDQDDQLARENAEPLVPYPAYVTTPAQEERWRLSVATAQQLAQGGYEDNLGWLSFVAHEVYQSDIPTR